jgi:dTDP-4-dehydrorhamnose reductase
MAVNGRVVIVGANGQLGSELVRAFAEDGRWAAVAVVHEEVEIADPASVRAMFAHHRPSLVVNTAAYHVAEAAGAELDFFRVNALGVKLLAEAARADDIPLVHFSTDYVFGDGGTRPYHEGDTPSPLNVYGISKLAGEHVLRATHSRHYVVRVCGLYGRTGCRAKGGVNFVETVLRQADTGSPMRVVNDQIVSQTYAVDVARALPELVARASYGVYHMVNPGACSWYEFAVQILELAGQRARLELEPVSSASYYSSVVRRPPYSALENRALRAAGLPDLRPRTSAVAAYLQERMRTRA